MARGEITEATGKEARGKASGLPLTAAISPQGERAGDRFHQGITGKRSIELLLFVSSSFCFVSDKQEHHLAFMTSCLCHHI